MICFSFRLFTEKLIELMTWYIIIKQNAKFINVTEQQGACQSSETFTDDCKINFNFNDMFSTSITY